jgi:hypothetical protein
MSDRNRIRERRRYFAAVNYDPKRHEPREKTPEELDRIAKAKARKAEEEAERRSMTIIRIGARVPMQMAASVLALSGIGLAAMSRGRQRRLSRR